MSSDDEDTKETKKKKKTKKKKLLCKYCKLEFAFPSTLRRHEIEVCKRKQNHNKKLVAFGKEDLSHIDNKMYKELIVKGKKAVPLLIKKVYCDEKYPNNNILQINTIQNKFAKKYNGTEWITVLKKNLLTELIGKYGLVLNKKYAEVSKDMTDNENEDYNDYMDMLDNIKKEKIINKEMEELIILYIYNYTKNSKNKVIQDSSSESESSSDSD